jgi:hypothetical protein
MDAPRSPSILVIVPSIPLAPAWYARSAVQSVVQELRGEKIDIVQWSDDPAAFVGNAWPAKIYKINVNPEVAPWK